MSGLFDIVDYLAISEFEKTGDVKKLGTVLRHANLLAGLQKSPESIAEDRAREAEERYQDEISAEIRRENEESARIKAKQDEEARVTRVKFASLDTINAIEQMFDDIK